MGPYVDHQGPFTVPAFVPPESTVKHFFGTRTEPAGPAARLRVGEVVAGSSTSPWIASVKQVHGTDVVKIARKLRSSMLPAGDALMTDAPNMLLVVRTADCLPLLLADIRRKVVAAVHAGWRGTLAGIVAATISAMREEFGAHPDDLRAAIGPTIGVCCYEVGEAVLRPLKETVSCWPEVLAEEDGMKARLDLGRVVRRQLAACGVRESAIHAVNACTKCRADLFYSYRREGRVNGTMISGIMVAE